MDKRPTPDQIIDAACWYYGVHRPDLIQRRTTRPFHASIRQIAPYPDCRAVICAVMQRQGYSFRDSTNAVGYTSRRAARAGAARATRAVVAHVEWLARFTAASPHEGAGRDQGHDRPPD